MGLLCPTIRDPRRLGSRVQGVNGPGDWVLPLGASTSAEHFLFPTCVPGDIWQMGPGPQKAHSEFLADACLTVVGISQGFRPLSCWEAFQFRVTINLSAFSHVAYFSLRLTLILYLNSRSDLLPSLKSSTRPSLLISRTFPHSVSSQTPSSLLPWCSCMHCSGHRKAQAWFSWRVPSPPSGLCSDP